MVTDDASKSNSIGMYDAPVTPTMLARAQESLHQYQAELEVQNQVLKSAQVETRVALGRYRTLFETLPLPALVLDVHGLLQEVNTAALDFFGFQYHRQVLNHSVFRLLGMPNDARLAQALKEACPERHPILRDWIVRDAQGAEHTMEGHVSVLNAAFHLDGHRLLLLLDRTDQACRERDNRIFRAVLDNANVLVYAFDREGCCVLANAHLAKVLERKPDELLGHTRQEWLSPAELQLQVQHDHQVFLNQRPIAVDETLQLRGGPKRHFIGHKFPLKDERGRIFAVAGISTEVTAQRQIEQRLQWAMAVFNQGSEGVLICDERNTIVQVNAAFQRITGYAEAEVMGRNPSLLASGRHDLAFYRQFWHELQTYGHWEGEIWNRRKDGAVYPQWLRVSRVSKEGSLPESFVGVFSDLSIRKASEEQIERLAFYDLLTNTPNRHLLRDRLEQAIRVGTRERTQFAVLFLDLDHFKEVNDVHGHDVGDEVLIEVSRRLQANLRAQDTVCRQGGDEFILLMAPIDQTGAQACVHKLLAAMAQPFLTSQGELKLSASIGVAMFPDDARSVQTLMRNADSAMYEAKHNGRSGYSFFSADMAQQSAFRVAIERSLRSAVGTDELTLHFQPKLDLTTGLLLGAEALLRWNSPTLGIMAPDVFIPVAEDSGLIVPLGTWVLEQALTQIKTWQASGLGWLQVSVNVSAGQFWKQDLPELVADRLRVSGVPPSMLDLELTERVAMVNPQEGVRICERLKGLGVSLSMDDFGTGYSSLSYLSRLPMDVLKIDQSFVRRLGDNRQDEQIVRSIVQLAHSLSLRTVAEGVETSEQHRFLHTLGCDQGQGYLFARPLPANTFTQWWQQHLSEAWVHKQ
jgi:diguanylate cyclase (GGDEF)-like protein/PAS domain S-box-containing protein